LKLQVGLVFRADDWLVRFARVEEKSLYYACLARLMRECGLGMLIIIRFSAVPGHVVTAIQSTVGISWWIYSLAVIATLPKQLVFVYLGVECKHR